MEAGDAAATVKVATTSAKGAPDATNALPGAPSKKLTILFTPEEVEDGALPQWAPKEWPEPADFLGGPLPEDFSLELEIKGLEDVAPLLSHPPPLGIRQHVTHLRLAKMLISPSLDWAAWLGGSTWPRLQQLTLDYVVIVDTGDSSSDSDEEQPLEQPLPPPIPTLRKLTVGRLGFDPSALPHLLALASGPHMESLEWGADEGLDVALSRLPHLASVRVTCLRLSDEQVEALVGRPDLQHVELESYVDEDWPDLADRPCAWRTLALGGCDLGLLATKLPVAKVAERVVIGGCFPCSGEDDTSAGVELLQRLHEQGKLKVLPMEGVDEESAWLWSGRGVCYVGLGDTEDPALLFKVLPLLLSASSGVSCLGLDIKTMTPAVLQQLGPILEGSGVSSLLSHVDDDPPSPGLLAALPTSITGLSLIACRDNAKQVMGALLQDGTAATRPVTVVLIEEDPGEISAGLEAELRQLAQEHHPEVTLEVERRPKDDASSDSSSDDDES